jgi:hypothetical protein
MRGGARVKVPVACAWWWSVDADGVKGQCRERCCPKRQLQRWRQARWVGEDDKWSSLVGPGTADGGLRRRSSEA